MILCWYSSFQVALKIVKHCHEEGPGEISQGVLLGLLVDKKLEITNCFPHPRPEDDNFDEGNMEILKVSNSEFLAIKC